jgi:hypothetical protein
MIKSKQTSLIGFFIVLVILVGTLLLLSDSGIEPRAEVSISVLYYTNAGLARQRTALIQVKNDGDLPTMRHPLCTLNWTNAAGEATHASILLSTTNVFLAAKNIELVEIPLPQDATAFLSLFSFTRPLTAVEHIRDAHPLIDRMLPRRKTVPTHVILGPVLTNSPQGDVSNRTKESCMLILGKRKHISSILS